MGIFVAIIVIFIISIIYIYNRIITLRNHVYKSKSGIDVYLKQRFDLIPNLIEVTKEYINYEKEILERITELRGIYNESKDVKATNELNIKYKTIMAVAENNPDLKANEQFLKLQQSLIKVESQLQAARRIYNNDVTRYNTKIAIFPNNIVARWFNFKETELFILDGEDKVSIKF